MLHEYVDRVIGKYADMLSVEGKQAFVAHCVRRGYTQRETDKAIALDFFEQREVSQAGIVLGNSSRGVSVSAVCRQRVARRASKGVYDHMRDCEREGLFDAASKVAESVADSRKALMYKELSDYVLYGPTNFDESYMFGAAELTEDESVAKHLRGFASLVRDLRLKKDYDLA